MPSESDGGILSFFLSFLLIQLCYLAFGCVIVICCYASFYNVLLFAFAWFVSLQSLIWSISTGQGKTIAPLLIRTLFKTSFYSMFFFFFFFCVKSLNIGRKQCEIQNEWLSWNQRLVSFKLSNALSLVVCFQLVDHILVKNKTFLKFNDDNLMNLFGKALSEGLFLCYNICWWLNWEMLFIGNSIGK